MTKILVVDASVLLKWVLDDEECGPEALKLRDDYLADQVEIVIAHHTMLEVSSALWVATRRKRISAMDANDAMRAMQALSLAVLPASAVQALELAASTGVSPYDCAYVVLASALAATVVTADESFARAFASAGVLHLKGHLQKDEG